MTKLTIHNDSQCPNYNNEPVLPNEQGNCSLCEATITSTPMNKYSNTTEWKEREYNEKLGRLALLNNASKSHKFELVDDPTNDGRESIRLVSKLPIKVNYASYESRYHFYLDHKLPYIGHYNYQKVAEKYESNKPQKVGIPSDKKINDWINYLALIYKDLVTMSNELQVEVSQFIAQMQQLNATFSKRQDYEVLKGIYNGYVVRNGIEFEFSVQDEGYISRKIKLHYKVPNSIEAFLQVSDNKFNQ